MNNFNFVEVNDQRLDFSAIGLRRNSYPYKPTSINTDYDGYYSSRNKVTQEIEVNFVAQGDIRQYEIENKGTGYKVKDKLRLKTVDVAQDLGPQLSRVGGKKIVSVVLYSNR